MSEPSSVPARQVFEQAVAFNRLHGHENAGFLSADHGFLPMSPPLTALPEAYRGWDDIAAQLPDLFRQLQVRRALDALPALPFDEPHLPDRYLLRAASLVSILAHSYARADATPIQELPPVLAEVWETVARRLERPMAFMSYVDLILYNWRLRRPPAGPMPAHDYIHLDNLDLMFPTVGNAEERIFYLTQVEIAAAAAPLLLSVVRAQEAAVNDDSAALENELLGMLAAFQQLSETIVHKIDPNPYSRTHVDPVVWAKTVAPFAVPVAPGYPGPSGTAAPIFHLMDAFWTRPSNTSVLGRESAKLADLAPRHWRALIAAVRQVSVRQHIQRSGSRFLEGLFDAVLDAYAGDKGFLGVHRLKAQGFLEVAFKAGRSVTIGGFKGLFADKTWTQIDRELLNTRDERYIGLASHPYRLLPKQGYIHDIDETRGINFISLSTADTGLHYRPGDRVSILPENSDELVERTLEALRATGSEPVALDRAWQAAVQQRGAAPNTPDLRKELPLAELLRFGRIRPLERGIAKKLHALSSAVPLRQVLDNRMEDQWELWEALELLSAAGFDVRRLWRSSVWEAEHITHIVPPEKQRLYSIASAMDAGQELHLTVMELAYRPTDHPLPADRPRRGTASAYLHRVTEEPERHPEIALKVVPGGRFRLPVDPARPIVMFAAGSGIAPFIGFLQERTRQSAAANWLFYGTRTLEEFHHHDYLEQIAGRGQLELRLALSQQDAQVVLEDGRFVTKPSRRARIDRLIEEEAAEVWNLLLPREAGGLEGHVYICGRTNFAAQVMASLQAVIARFADSADEAREVFYQLTADRRLMLDVFTTYSGPASQAARTFDASEVVLHNSDAQGYWMVLDGKVLDLSDFVHIHAGGRHILANNAGIDATRAYRSVQHHVNPEVDALLGMYEIGQIRRLDLSGHWGVGIGMASEAGGLFFFTLQEAFTTWVRYLYLVTEMENAVANDFSFLRRPITGAEAADAPTPLKLHLLAEAHKRYISVFLDGVLGEDLQLLWAITSGLCDETADIRWMRTALDQVQAGGGAGPGDAALVRSNVAQTWLDAWQGQEGVQAQASFGSLQELAALLDAENRRCFSELKMALRDGVRVFELHEARAVELGGERLLAALRQIPTVVAAYYARVADGIRFLAETGGLPLRADAAADTTVVLTGHGSQIYRSGAEDGSA